jgi:hypothetical protein
MCMLVCLYACMFACLSYVCMDYVYMYLCTAHLLVCVYAYVCVVQDRCLEQCPGCLDFICRKAQAHIHMKQYSEASLLTTYVFENIYIYADICVYVFHISTHIHEAI